MKVTVVGKVIRKGVSKAGNAYLQVLAQDGDAYDVVMVFGDVSKYTVGQDVKLDGHSNVRMVYLNSK